MHSKCFLLRAFCSFNARNMPEPCRRQLSSGGVAWTIARPAAARPAPVELRDEQWSAGSRAEGAAGIIDVAAEGSRTGGSPPGHDAVLVSRSRTDPSSSYLKKNSTYINHLPHQQHYHTQHTIMLNDNAFFPPGSCCVIVLVLLLLHHIAIFVHQHLGVWGEQQFDLVHLPKPPPPQQPPN